MVWRASSECWVGVYTTRNRSFGPLGGGGGGFRAWDGRDPAGNSGEVPELELGEQETKSGSAEGTTGNTVLRTLAPGTTTPSVALSEFTPSFTHASLLFCF